MSIATMDTSGGGPQPLRWGQSRANPFTQCEHQALNGKWLTECAILSSFMGVYGSLRVYGTFASPTASAGGASSLLGS